MDLRIIFIRLDISFVYKDGNWKSKSERVVLLTSKSSHVSIYEPLQDANDKPSRIIIF